MKTQELSKTPCYEQNHENKSIETKFKVNGHTIEILQRRLTGGEAIRHENDLKNVYTDPDVYKSLLKQNRLDAELKRLQKTAKKDKKITVPIDDETEFIMYKGRVAMEKQNRKVNALFIAYSCEDSELEGGSFLYDGKEVSFKRKLKIIDELGKDEEDDTVDYFNLLFANANKLTYPTKQEKDNAKS